MRLEGRSVERVFELERWCDLNLEHWCSRETESTGFEELVGNEKCVRREFFLSTFHFELFTLNFSL